MVTPSHHLLHHHSLVLPLHHHPHFQVQQQWLVLQKLLQYL